MTASPTEKGQHETRIHVRELLANHGPLSTRVLASRTRVPTKRMSKLLSVMSDAKTIRAIGRNDGQNYWALRCWRNTPVEPPQVGSNGRSPRKEQS